VLGEEEMDEGQSEGLGDETKKKGERKKGTEAVQEGPSWLEKLDKDHDGVLSLGVWCSVL